MNLIKKILIVGSVVFLGDNLQALTFTINNQTDFPLNLNVLVNRAIFIKSAWTPGQQYGDGKWFPGPDQNATQPAQYYWPSKQITAHTVVPVRLPDGQQQMQLKTSKWVYQNYLINYFDQPVALQIQSQKIIGHAPSPVQPLVSMQDIATLKSVTAQEQPIMIAQYPELKTISLKDGSTYVVALDEQNNLQITEQ